MICGNQNNTSNGCGCDFNVKTIGVADVTNINIDGKNRTGLNWTEISVPEILSVPALKPDIESIDQVYANIALNSTRLVETPFAYKKYILYDFYESTQGLDTSLPPLSTALSTAVNALLAPITGALTTAINTAITAIKALIIPLPGDQAALTVLQNILNSINQLVAEISAALAEVVNTISSLVAAVNAVPFLPEVICNLIVALISALDALQILVSAVPTFLATVLTELQGLTGLTPAIQLLITAIITILTTGVLSPTAVQTLVNAVLTAIINILNAVGVVNCEEAYVIVLISNVEGTCLSGRKLIIEGVLKQKVIYTAEVAEQSVHSAHYEIPFSAFIIPYANFDGLAYREGIEVYNPENPTVPAVINGFIIGANQEINPNLCEEFIIDSYIEDIFIYAMDPRTIFKNVTVFLRARVAASCS